MTLLLDILLESWHLLLDASVYILFGLLVGGMLKVFLNPAFVANHLGRGRFVSVFKAALFGIPIPLCSCGVLPAAASLKRQGANNGATTAFLVSTPESGVDSMAISYALLDPIMTVARPVAAFVSAVAAGIIENLFQVQSEEDWRQVVDHSCPVDGCCDGIECEPADHVNHHSFGEKIKVGLSFAVHDLWGDLAGWFLAGLLLAGVITTLIPDDMMVHYLGGGMPAMLLMLLVGIPMYICATASTPVAAALILKGVSPGAALVFLLVGPATNITSLSVLFGLLGKRATAVYLIVVSVSAVLCGLLLDRIYGGLGISAQAVVGRAAEIIPYWGQLAGALVLILLSIKPLLKILRRFVDGKKTSTCEEDASCGCGSPTPVSLPKAAPPRKNSSG